MTEGNRDNGRYNSANEAWSKNWLVPILLLMLRQWSSYGYELMEKMSTFGLAAIESRHILPYPTADGKGWDGKIQLGYFRRWARSSYVLDY